MFVDPVDWINAETDLDGGMNICSSRDNDRERMLETVSLSGVPEGERNVYAHIP